MYQDHRRKVNEKEVTVQKYDEALSCGFFEKCREPATGSFSCILWYNKNPDSCMLPGFCNLSLVMIYKSFKYSNLK